VELKERPERVIIIIIITIIMIIITNKRVSERARYYYYLRAFMIIHSPEQLSDRCERAEAERA